MEIFLDAQLAGEIYISKEEKDYEISVAVFDRFSRKGVGEEALKKFLKENKIWPLSAVIRIKNSIQDKVVGLLKECGFKVVDGTVGKTNVILQMNSRGT